MAQLAVFIEINEELLSQIDAQLARMARPTTEPLHKGLRKALEITKKRNYDILPKPGYPGDRKDKPPLRESLMIKTQEYQRASNANVLGMVGYNWYGGQHGHIVEHGHRIATKKSGKLGRPKAEDRFTSHTGKRFSQAGIVQGRFYLQKSVEATKSQHDAAVVAGIVECIDKTLGPNPTAGA